MSKVTLLIQGPMTELVSKNIASSSFDHVVVSTWEPATKSEKDFLRGLGEVARVVVSQRLSPSDMKHLGSLGAQVWSTLAGLEEIETPYVVKIRSDEYYVWGGMAPTCTVGWTTTFGSQTSLFGRGVIIHFIYLTIFSGGRLAQSEMRLEH